MLINKSCNILSVTKMLAVMTEQSPDSNKDPVEAFLSSGRTGRRNALADIRGEHASTSTSNLPECLEKLTTRGKLSYKNHIELRKRISLKMLKCKTFNKGCKS